MVNLFTQAFFKETNRVMKTASFADTIFALATPPGRSALAVIRVSGETALAVPAAFGAAPITPRQAHRRWLKDAAGSLLDDVMLIGFAGPASATGEDVLEIHTHGSPAVVEDILHHLAAQPGCRPAEAGEFTRRALDNGKTDITAAEGLVDLIAAETSLQRRQATAQMAGSLRRPVEAWRQDIISCLSLLEASIDFADEELPDTLQTQIQDRIQAIFKEMTAGLAASRRGEMVRSGLSVVLAGPVNAGKSTTLNALARRPAAIVSDRPGTTRDSVEVSLDISGVPVVLTDTAGWRQTDDPVEGEGINRARQAASQADLLLVVVDGSQPGWADQVLTISGWSQADVFVLVNKQDKGMQDEQKLLVSADILAGNVIAISAQDGTGLDQLEDRLDQFVADLNSDQSSVMLTRVRHRQALSEASHHLQASLTLSVADQTELVAEEFRSATVALSRILGQIDIEDVLDHIFSSFCIGK